MMFYRPFDRSMGLRFINKFLKYNYCFFYQEEKIDLHLYSTLCIYYIIDVTRERIHREKKQYFGIFIPHFFADLGKLNFVVFIVFLFLLKSIEPFVKRIHSKLYLKLLFHRKITLTRSRFKHTLF